MTRFNSPKNSHISATEDGVFAPSSNEIAYDYSIPFLKGELIIPSSPSLKDYISQYGGSLAPFVQGRSAHAQLGINLTSRKDGNYWEDGEFHVPVKVSSLGDDREEWLRLLQGNAYKLGRVVFMEEKSALNKDEVEDAFSQNDISIGNDYRINEDGSISIKLSPFEYVVASYQANTNKQFKDLILGGGRSALLKNQDIVPLNIGDKIEPDKLFIGGIRLSSGKYSALIDPECINSVRHLEGGTFLDAFRTTGIAPRLGKAGMRQVELFNYGETEVPVEDIEIKIYLYPPDVDQSKERTLWGGFSDSEKSRVHDNGINLVQVGSINDSEVLDSLFVGIDHGGDVWGRVITPAGDISIGKEQTPLLQLSSATSALKDVSSVTGFTDDAIADFGKKLPFAKDQGMVLLFHELPSDTAAIDDLVKNGVRCFVFKSIGGDVHNLQNVYISPDVHSKIWELSKKGISFYFNIEGDEGAELREFYKGFFLTEENKERFDSVDTVINMYGWHGSVIEKLAEKDVRSFFKGLIDLYGVEKLAIAHGKGPGFMAVADKVARELGIFSIGVGISVEKIGQGKANLAPDAFLDFPSKERSYRQSILDKIVDFPLFNIGGDGTHEESAITTCSTKILEYLPLPLIYIDISDGEDHLWSNEQDLQKELSSGKSLFINAENLLTNEYPLAKEWVPNIKHYVKSYADGLAIIKDFMNNPCDYWENAGISSHEIKTAFENQKAISDKYERSISDYLANAAESYISKNK